MLDPFCSVPRMTGVDDSDKWQTDFDAMLKRTARESEAFATEALTVGDIRTFVSDDQLVSRVFLRLLGTIGMIEPPGAGQPDPVRAFFATTCFENDAMNGGFTQYVVNQGELAEDALLIVADGYRIIGVPSMADLALRAMSIGADERAIRHELGPCHEIHEFTMYVERSKLPTLDDSLEDTEALRAAFVRKNATAFAD
jgi:hypothetical protein